MSESETPADDGDAQPEPPQAVHEIRLSPAHAVMAEEMGADNHFLAMAAQKVLENQYEQFDAQRRQQMAQQDQTLGEREGQTFDVDDEAVEAATEELDGIEPDGK